MATITGSLRNPDPAPAEGRRRLQAEPVADFTAAGEFLRTYLYAIARLRKSAYQRVILRNAFHAVLRALDAKLKPRPQPAADSLLVGGRSVPLLLVPNPRARRYLLRLRPDGVVRVTIPRRGTVAAAREFAAKNAGWLERQWQMLAARPATPEVWRAGTEILFRGEPVRLELTPDGAISFGAERLSIADAGADWRPAVEWRLRQMAARELPRRVVELAALHNIGVTRITVRNQKSRWGSCSRRGTISLNWRLIQAPEFVRDYLILHELAHRRQMNHSAKFWEEVARLCPNYLESERWLKGHAKLLR